MTETNKPTTVAQDVEALRAVVDGQHATNETTAQVLADTMNLLDLGLSTQVGSRVTFHATRVKAMRDRLERSLAAGKVVATVRTVYAGEECNSVEWEPGCGLLPDGTELYTAPPADPAKASEPDLHPKTADLVSRFARALAEKLSAAEKKYGYSDGWSSPDWMDECRSNLIAHVYKGDPRDVAAYCAFLWHHGSHTDPRSPFCEKCGSAEACDCTTTAKASEPDEVRIDFPGIGHAGPFAVVNGEVTLPAETMSDLAHHFRMGYVAKVSDPEYDRSLIADMLDDYINNRGIYAESAIRQQIEGLRAADNADAAKVRTVRGSGSAPDDAHHDDIAVDRFAAEMKAKLATARAKGRGGWDGPECNAEVLADIERSMTDVPPDALPELWRQDAKAHREKGNIPGFAAGLDWCANELERALAAGKADSLYCDACAQAAGMGEDRRWLRCP